MFLQEQSAASAACCADAASVYFLESAVAAAGRQFLNKTAVTKLAGFIMIKIITAAARQAAAA